MKTSIVAICVIVASLVSLGCIDDTAVVTVNETVYMSTLDCIPQDNGTEIKEVGIVIENTTVTNTNPVLKPIYINKYSLSHKEVTINVGDTLNFINLQKDPYYDFTLVIEDHNATQTTTLRHYQRFEWTFWVPGNYTYQCPGFGSTMQGIVRVV